MDCIKCGSQFEPRQIKTRPRKKCYSCSPEGKNTTEKINAECANDVRAFMRQLRHKGRGGLRAKELELDDLMHLWVQQDGKCDISGIAMTHVWGKHNVFNASPDQIVPATSGGSYHPSNVRLVCKIFQGMKMALTDEEFKNAILIAADNIKKNQKSI